jgi:hypothetical protein
MAKHSREHVRSVLERVRRHQPLSYFENARELAEDVTDTLDLYEDDSFVVPSWIQDLADEVFVADPRMNR